MRLPDQKLLGAEISEDSVAQYLDLTDPSRQQPTTDQLKEFCADLKEAGYKTVAQMDQDLRRARAAADRSLCVTRGNIPHSLKRAAITLSIAKKSFRQSGWWLEEDCIPFEGYVLPSPESHEAYIKGLLIQHKEPSSELLAKPLSTATLREYFGTVDSGMNQQPGDKLQTEADRLKRFGYRTIASLHKDHLRGRGAADAFLDQKMGGHIGFAGDRCCVSIMMLNKGYRNEVDPGSDKIYAPYARLVLS